MPIADRFRFKTAEALRRKAEAFGASSEAARRSLEETLRRDLLAAHAALADMAARHLYSRCGDEPSVVYEKIAEGC